MEIKNVNSYLIDSELQGKGFPFAFYFTNATESEFKALLNNFLSEYEIKEDSKFNPGVFTAYVQKMDITFILEKIKFSVQSIKKNTSFIYYFIFNLMRNIFQTPFSCITQIMGFNYSC
jgi:hypothetical protein